MVVFMWCITRALRLLTGWCPGAGSAEPRVIRHEGTGLFLAPTGALTSQLEAALWFDTAREAARAVRRHACEPDSFSVLALSEAVGCPAAA